MVSKASEDLPDLRETGYHGEGVAWNLYINVLEIVNPGAPYIYFFF